MSIVRGWQKFELRSGEWRLCVACNRWVADRALLHLFRWVSRLGDGPVWYALMLGLALLGGERGRMAALHMAVIGLIAASLYRLLKGWTRRPRPYRSHAGIVAHIAPLDEFSFPSGHTLHAVSFSIVAIAWYPPLMTVLLPFTTLIAISRVVLGLHYPSDVIVAILIATAMAGSSVLLVFPQ
ncbi:phosphatase PAP2 family protein [Dokdonella sp.]|uniref:phosphatase PAP2 family protein n=1 Tax=Dokdonella sp. TaxID=2291710 RepID=UPI003527C80D